MGNGIFAAFASAILVVAFAPRQKIGKWEVRVAWLAERESALGDWQAVRPPLREGDELQLSLLSSEDACVYVLDDSRAEIFSHCGLHAHWPYAIPGSNTYWSLDGAE